MTTINNMEETRILTAGAKVYICPWSDYRNTNFWCTYAHAVSHAFRLGWFDLPLWMIKTGLGF